MSSSPQIHSFTREIKTHTKPPTALPVHPAPHSHSFCEDEMLVIKGPRCKQSQYRASGHVLKQAGLSHMLLLGMEPRGSGNLVTCVEVLFEGPSARRQIILTYCWREVVGAKGG